MKLLVLKISVAVRAEEQRLTLLNHCFQPDYAIVALVDNNLVGIAGFHTPLDPSLAESLTVIRLSQADFSHKSLTLCFSQPVSVLTGPTISMWRTYD